jgi:hypothetical protein
MVGVASGQEFVPKPYSQTAKFILRDPEVSSNACGIFVITIKAKQSKAKQSKALRSSDVQTCRSCITIVVSSIRTSDNTPYLRE